MGACYFPSQKLCDFYDFLHQLTVAFGRDSFFDKKIIFKADSYMSAHQNSHCYDRILKSADTGYSPCGTCRNTVCHKKQISWLSGLAATRGTKPAVRARISDFW